MVRAQSEALQLGAGHASDGDVGITRNLKNLSQTRLVRSFSHRDALDGARARTQSFEHRLDAEDVRAVVFSGLRPRRLARRSRKNARRTFALAPSGKSARHTLARRLVLARVSSSLACIGFAPTPVRTIFLSMRAIFHPMHVTVRPVRASVVSARASVGSVRTYLLTVRIYLFPVRTSGPSVRTYIISVRAYFLPVYAYFLLVRAYFLSMRTIFPSMHTILFSAHVTLFPAPGGRRGIHGSPARLPALARAACVLPLSTPVSSLMLHELFARARSARQERRRA
jgi:hypothetical protein